MKYFLYMISIGILSSCGISDSSMVSGTSYTLNNSEADLADRVVVENNKTLEIDDSSLSLTKKGHYSKDDYTLKLVGEVPSPKIDGLSLQATDVYTDGSYAYVSYNYSGEEKRGGLEIFDVSDEDDPKSISQILFNDSDISALAFDGDDIFAVGSDGESEPAFVSKFELSKNKFSSSIHSVRLSSFVGTDVSVNKNTVAVTSGSDGHLSFFSSKVLSKISDVSLESLRSVDFDSKDKVWALQGESGRVLEYDIDGTVETTEIAIGGAELAEAKSTISAGDETLIVALNESGVKILCKDSGTVIGEIEQLSVSGLSSEKTVTNAATMEKGLLFTANGEAGVAVYSVDVEKGKKHEDTSCSSRTISKLGTLSFGSDLSANHVFYKKDYLFVADGLGGLKIVYVSKSEKGKKEDKEREDKHDYDHDKKDDDDIKICHKGKKTLELPKSAVAAHLLHGDIRGECDEDEDD